MLYICSIWPGELVAERPGYEPEALFRLEPAKKETETEKGKISFLAIRQSHQPEYVGHGRVRPHLMNDEVVANDVMGQWRSGKTYPNLPETAGIGLWLVRSETPPTQRELKASEEYRKAVAELTVYARFIVEQARRYAQSPNLRRDIGPLHYLMAEFLNIENEAWQSPQTAQQMKQCPYCRKSVDVEASVCPVCTKTIDPERYRQIAEQASARMAPAPPAPAQTQEPVTAA